MSFWRNHKAFSLTELLTTVGIVGVVSVVGIRSYQKQTNEARTAEAKKSLAYVYAAERNFHNSWGAYHENLISVGAVPSGSYVYDVGFKRTASLADNTALTGAYPRVNAQDVLNVRECTNFGEICDAICIATLTSRVGSTYSSYFSSSDCSVSTGDTNVELKNYTGNPASAGATQNNFKAIATGKLKGIDVWSIDQGNAVTHEVDGTQ
ncbi:MAG: prepilin-type N-terminal cleavage/methylation domain-containing protein [Oligoflexia bacterium]|nr:prepilin-type N-terminal cleavage/methylation domain-containing protein [Oligoflexia bacterium]